MRSRKLFYYSKNSEFKRKCLNIENYTFPKWLFLFSNHPCLHFCRFLLISFFRGYTTKIYQLRKMNQIFACINRKNKSKRGVPKSEVWSLKSKFFSDLKGPKITKTKLWRKIFRKNTYSMIVVCYEKTNFHTLLYDQNDGIEYFRQS